MNKKQTNFDKDVLKTIVNKSLTKSDAIRALTGESGGKLKLIITGDPDVHKYFYNDSPISEKEFNRLSGIKTQKGNCKVNVTIGGRRFRDADKEMIE
jgi:hypothetical protein